MDFGSGDPLSTLNSIKQVKYLISYLTVLKAKTVLVEPNYFDKDYLSEFSAFYSCSSKGYVNTCQRLHFFDYSFDRQHFRRAIGGSKNNIERLKKHYLGFIILRPLPDAPLGKTVLKLFPENDPNLPRITNPKRKYYCHVAGLRISVEGLAWQQQDAAVGACATIALWSLLHASAFDETHAISTTADITKAANKSFSFGQRLFPSDGLTIQQIMGAIKEHNLAPIVFDGDIGVTGAKKFGKERFASTIANLLRSNYPVLLGGNLQNTGGHAIIAVGFRETVQSDHKSINLLDSDINYLYIHDDNLGPNVRFKIEVDDNDCVYLLPSAPQANTHIQNINNPISNYPKFIPTHLIVAVNHELRTNPNVLHTDGFSKANYFYNVLKTVQHLNLTFSTIFIKISDYLENELYRILGSKKYENILAKTRLSLCEKVPPISLFIGIVRIGYENMPLLDIIYDTSDSDIHHPIFANIAYHQISSLIAKTMKNNGIDMGVSISAY